MSEHFTGFSPETEDFFWELCFNNDRTWFYQHKESFETLIGNPMKALARDTTEILVSRYPDTELAAKVSRIWRDARRLFGRGPLKESMWFSIRNGRPGAFPVSFYFELKPATFTCGMGYWCENAKVSEAFRARVDSNPAEFIRLAKEINKLDGFVLEGPEYRKPKGDFGPAANNWYNRKWVDLNHTENFGGAILLPEYPEILADFFGQFMSMFEFLSGIA